MIFTPKPFYSRAQCHTERMPRRGTVCANLATQQLPLSTSWISSTTFLDQLSTPSSPYYASIFLSMYLSINQYQSIHPLDYNAASKRSPQISPVAIGPGIHRNPTACSAAVLWPRPRRDGWMYLPGPTCEACGIQWDPVQHLPSCQQLVPLVGYWACLARHACTGETCWNELCRAAWLETDRNRKKLPQ